MPSVYAGAPGSSYQRFQIGLPHTYLPGVPLAAAAQPGSNNLPSLFPSQTDVFVIGADGGLDVHYIIGDGLWQVMQLWPRHIAAPGTPVAAGTRSNPEGFLEVTTQTYAFFVDKTGALNAYSVDRTGIWQRQLISAQGTFPPNTSIAVSQQFGTAHGSVGNQLDVFAIDVNGTLNVYYTSGAGWASQKILPHIVLTPGAPLTASQQFITGVNQTNLMTFDPSRVLNIFYVEGAGAWSWKSLVPENLVLEGCNLACSRQFGSPNNNSMQLDVFFVDGLDRLNIDSVVENGAWQKTMLADQATLPLKGIGSNANIELHNNCANIILLEVSILVTEDIRADKGIAFQLNCASGLGYSTTWQQYLFSSPPGSHPPAIKWIVNNWAGPETPINDGAVLLTLPAAPGVLIPARYRFVIGLVNLGFAVSGATYTVYDPSGNKVGYHLLNLEDEISHTTNKKININQLAPIIGFQLDIVGWSNGAATTLTSGAGIITYTIPPIETLQPLEVTIPCLDSSTIAITTETSNVSYQAIAVGLTNTFTQAFQAIATN